MTTEGSLADRDFPSLLQTLSEQRWTGTLTLTHAGVGRSVSIQGGRLVFATSSSPDDRMGPLLLRRGRITLRQMEAAMAALVSPGMRLGAALVAQGVLSPKELITAVVEHTQEILYGAFQWTEGHYRLQEGTISAEAITLRISTPDIILEGIHRIESWTRIAAAVGGKDALYERTPASAEIAAGMKLSPERAELLRRLYLPLTVDGLCGQPALGDFDVCRALWAFRVIGLVRRLDAVAPAVEIEDESLGIVVPEE
jgi:uncharacterized protein DUF4388